MGMQAIRQLTKLRTATLRSCCAARAGSTMGARASSTGRAPVLVPKLTPGQTSAALKRSSAVCFDVDSTVITTEGIDELGAFLGKAEEVRACSFARLVSLELARSGYRLESCVESPSFVITLFFF